MGANMNAVMIRLVYRASSRRCFVLCMPASSGLHFGSGFFSVSEFSGFECAFVLFIAMSFVRCVFCLVYAVVSGMVMFTFGSEPFHWRQENLLGLVAL